MTSEETEVEEVPSVESIDQPDSFGGEVMRKRAHDSNDGNTSSTESENDDGGDVTRFDIMGTTSPRLGRTNRGAYHESAYSA
jgi:hypothetical protein